MALRFATWLMAAGALSSGQFLPPMQASAQQEYDAYLRVTAEDPLAAVTAAAEFERAWPESELLAEVHQLAFEAHRRRGNLDASIASAQKALDAAPRNVTVVARLALILAGQPADAARLARGAALASQALELVDTFHPPRTVPPAAWTRIQGRHRSEAHEALGLVRFKQGKPADAIVHLEQAVREAPSPVASQWYRLGQLYREAGRTREARDSFRRVLALDEPLIRGLAESELKALEP